MRALASIRAVIIDLDGTLLDTAPDLATAANAMLAELGRPAITSDDASRYIGKGIVRLVERILAGSLDGQADPDLARRAQPIYERHYAAVSGANSSPYPGVIEGLRGLRALGLKLACVTNKAERFTLALLERTALAAHFDLIVSGDTLTRKKPDPEPLLHVCERFGIAPGAALMIGDSANDVGAARAAGCPVWCVPYGYNEGRPIESLACDRLIASLAEAAALLGEAATAEMAR